MDRQEERAVERCAAELTSLLESESARKEAAGRIEADIKATAGSLRRLGDEAVLAAVRRIYRAGAKSAQGKRSGDARSGRGARKHQSDVASLPAGPARTTLWLATAGLAGAVVMSLEIVAFRLYAPYLGYSIYVWGTMISVVMAALALGYAFGGWIADRSTTDFPLYGLILASSVYQLIVMFTGRSLLAEVADLGDFAGTLAATLVIFTPPMAGLAVVGPYVIRLLSRSGRAGSVAGSVYALSTVGSIAGILLASFVLIPRLGTTATLGVACGSSAILGAAGMVRKKPAAAPAAIALAALTLFQPRHTWGEGTIWVSESAYNLVRVVREGTQLILILNDERSVATRREESTGWTGGYFDDFSLGPLLSPARRALVLGMGAGSSISSMRASAPQVEIDAVEIDPQVVEAAVRFFGLRSDDERLHIHIADARPWVAADTGEYDIVQVDLYQGGPYIPFYLCTVEFFEAVLARMTGDGVLMMNVVDGGRELELLSSTVATLKRVFPTVAVFSRPTGNHMVLAFSREQPVESIRAPLKAAEGDDVVSRHARSVASALSFFEPRAGTAVFTDDHAPIEAITRRMLGSVAAARAGR